MCWEHVHEHMYNIYDMTYWTTHHDGNADADAGGRANPISKHLDNDNTIDFPFPDWHDMTRWRDRLSSLSYLGRFGDQVDFAALTVDVQTLEMAQYVGAITEETSLGFEACGAVDEVANDPLLGHHYYYNHDDETDHKRRRECDVRHTNAEGKTMLFLSTVYNATDQLRHRMAWALSQIFNVNEYEILIYPSPVSLLDPCGSSLDKSMASLVFDPFYVCLFRFGVDRVFLQEEWAVW